MCIYINVTNKCIRIYNTRDGGTRIGPHKSQLNRNYLLLNWTCPNYILFDASRISRFCQVNIFPSQCDIQRRNVRVHAYCTSSARTHTRRARGPPLTHAHRHAPRVYTRATHTRLKGRCCSDDDDDDGDVLTSRIQFVKTSIKYRDNRGYTRTWVVRKSCGPLLARRSGSYLRAKAPARPYRWRDSVLSVAGWRGAIKCLYVLLIALRTNFRTCRRHCCCVTDIMGEEIPLITPLARILFASRGPAALRFWTRRVDFVSGIGAAR